MVDLCTEVPLEHVANHPLPKTTNRPGKVSGGKWAVIYLSFHRLHGVPSMIYWTYGSRLLRTITAHRA
jgi:hypothetical protein